MLAYIDYTRVCISRTHRRHTRLSYTHIAYLYTPYTHILDTGIMSTHTHTKPIHSHICTYLKYTENTHRNFTGRGEGACMRDANTLPPPTDTEFTQKEV